VDVQSRKLSNFRRRGTADITDGQNMPPKAASSVLLVETNAVEWGQRQSKRDRAAVIRRALCLMSSLMSRHKNSQAEGEKNVDSIKFG